MMVLRSTATIKINSLASSHNLYCDITSCANFSFYYKPLRNTWDGSLTWHPHIAKIWPDFCELVQCKTRLIFLFWLCFRSTDDKMSEEQGKLLNLGHINVVGIIFHCKMKDWINVKTRCTISNPTKERAEFFFWTHRTSTNFTARAKGIHSC